MANSSEDCYLRYLAHTQTENMLTLKQRSEWIETTTAFTVYEDCNAIRVYTEVENISAESITLEEVSSFVCGGIGEKGIDLEYLFAYHGHDASAGIGENRPQNRR